jgi:hypothetical protein
VVPVIDPTGGGGDLTFTQGLSHQALPELLLWARPTEGTDPGADWLLGHRERAALLNRWAAELLAGRPLERFERKELFDRGTATARFRFPRSGPALLVHQTASRS